MADAIVWKNVAVTMQSAIASAKTISAITKASPGVATSTAHGYSNGDYVYLDVNGMHQLNEKVVRVANVTTDTFEIEGVDTTSFDTFTSGTAKEITYGTSVVTALTISASGGDFDFIDITTIHDAIKKQMPGMPNAISFEMDHIWDPADAGQIAMKAASDIQERRAVKFTFGTGGKVLVFSGYVGCTGLPGGQAQDKVTTKATFTMNGTPTYYSS